jgi:hypothetical protein
MLNLLRPIYDCQAGPFLVPRLVFPDVLGVDQSHIAQLPARG